MPVGEDGIRRVFRAFDKEDWDEIHLVTDDVEIHLVAAESNDAPPQTWNVLPVSSGTVDLDPPVSGSLHETAADEAAPAAPADVPAGSVAVGSPTPGIFWRAPSPGAPPFTETGARVEAGATLCIVEVMKLMSTLTAPTSGTVVHIGAQNGESIEAGRAPFLIAADGE